MVPIKSSTKTKASTSVKKKTGEKVKSSVKPISKATKTPKKTKLSVRVVDKAFILKNSKNEEAVVENIQKNPIIIEDLPKDNLEEIEIVKKEEEKFTQKKIDGDKEVKNKKNKDGRPSPGLYRNIALSFLFLTIILLGAVFYLYFVSLTIEIDPKKEIVKNKISFNVVDEKKTATGTSEGVILGAVESLEVKKDNIYKSSGEEILGHEIIGSVTLINNTAEDRPLVATTRLLTPDGKLFRLKDRVTIPANGRIKADIYTDEPAAEMAVSPTTFTIPGLWAGLQDKVYAKSDTAFVYNENVKKTVKQIDIDKAIDDLKKILLSEVNDKLGQDYKGFDKVIVKSNDSTLKTVVDAKIGDELESFKVSISIKVELVAFSRAAVENLANKKFTSSLTNDMKVFSVDENTMDYVLTNVDFEKGEASIELSFSGYAVSRKVDSILDKNKIVGLDKEQINEYLNSLDDFSDFKISFWPSFIKKAPMLTDRIRITSKE